jgi:hypothetical protein
MDQPSDISARTEPVIANKQNTEAIKSVASKLALVGDQLIQSHEELSCGKVRSCIKLESCSDILRLLLKS